MEISPPRRLYYYTPPDHALENLRKRQLKISRFKDCNDTFELEAVDLSDKDFRKNFKSFVEEYDRKLGLVCFSKTWKSPIMWSHYAAKHTGLCLAFDVNASNCFDVSYRSEKMYRGINGANFFDHVGEEQTREIFGTKSLHWAYEEEVRLLCSLENEVPDKKGLHFFGFGEDLVLRQVYLGEDSRHTIDDIKEALGDEKIEIVPTRRAFRSFKVVKQKNRSLWPRRKASPKKATVQALIFDVFGTCVDWRNSIAREVAAELPQVDALAFADAWRGEYQPAMERIRSGNRGYVALDDLHLENLKKVCADFGATCPHPEHLNHAWEKLDPWPDVVPGLTALKEHAIIAPCSNGSIALMTRLARYAGLPWDCILGADIARDYKPKPEVYLAACAALRLAPGAVMMVAAHNDDLAAARDAGLKTGFVPRPTENGAGQSTDLEATGPWDVVATDFNELTEPLFHAG